MLPLYETGSTEGPTQMLGFCFNLTYYMTVVLILSAIISGIIIDTFSDMRQTNNEVELDTRDLCFICNIER